VAIIVLLLFVLAAKDYIGYYYFYKYKEARDQAQSIEKSFPELERNLKKAVRLYKNPLFYEQMSRLYLEMALAEDKYGTEEKRDFYLDQARESLIEQINQNPLDAHAYYDLGRVYLLYNFPLLTYAEKGRLYFRKALELKPADEYLNVHIIYIYLTQWESLNRPEKAFLFGQLGDVVKYNENFIPQIRDLWKQNYGDTEKLKDILSTNKDLLSKLSDYF